MIIVQHHDGIHHRGGLLCLVFIIC